MQSELTVELGAEDPTLAVPWSDPEGRFQYFDLRQNPDTVQQIEEARTFSDLGEFLLAMNSTPSALQTAKCDAWFTEELTEEEAIFGASCKFGSYVDAFFYIETPRQSFPLHEAFGRRIVELLNRAPELPGAFEAIIRRAHFEGDGEVREGFYFTLYALGYGDDEPQARQSWSITLRLVRNAILQISSL